jgi:chaperonin cofactor prefoldin
MSQQLVSLELDEKDKENFQELQGEIAKAQGELANTTQKLRVRAAEERHASATFAALGVIPDECRAFEQVGKMFLLRPLPELKKSLSDSVESAQKDVASLTEKRGHVEEAFKKVQADFQEFVKAHMVEAEAEKKDEKK